VCTGDFNEDGITDLAVAAQAGPNVLLGNGAGGVGDGTFATRVEYAVGNSVDLQIGDFNADGRADLLSAGSVARVMLGDGVGSTGNGGLVAGDTLELGSTGAIAVNDWAPGAAMDAVLAQSGATDRLWVLSGGCSPVAPSVTLVAPNGLESLEIGAEQTLSWTRSAGVMAVNVEISRDDGAHWERIASHLTEDSFVWTVTGPDAALARARVVDAQRYTVSDESDAAFQVHAPSVDVPEASNDRASFSRPWPNPSATDVSFGLALPSEAQVGVEILDVSGRHVGWLAHGRLAPGQHRIRWEQGDDAVRRAPAGIYFVRARWAGFEAVRRVVRMR
jgi:hypothetical protein